MCCTAKGKSPQKQLANAKTLLKKIIFAPLRVSNRLLVLSCPLTFSTKRVNVAYKGFATGIRDVFTDMNKDLSDTMAAIANATQQSGTAPISRKTTRCA